MALSSPGVEVSVIDESFYTPAAASTVPLIIVGTAANKPNGSGTGTAAGTLAANAGTPYLITSQRELTDTFGNPKFYTDSSNNPLHGNELNEYGLQAAYSFLGVANRAYVVRADADLGQLTGSSSAPAGDPADGTYWFDTNDSLFGIFVWNKTTEKFTNKIPLVLNSATDLVGDVSTGDPKTSVGSKGDYAVVTARTSNDMYYKNADNAWVKIGTTTSANIAAVTGSATDFSSDSWASSWPTVVSGVAPTGLNNGDSIYINGTSVTISGTTADAMAQAINGASIDGVAAKSTSTGFLEIYTDGTSKSDGSSVDGAIFIQNGAGTLLTDMDITATYYTGPAVQISKHSSVPEWKSTDTITVDGLGADGQSKSAIRPTGSVWMKTTTPNLGANLKVSVWNDTLGAWSTVSTPIYNTRQEATAGIDSTGGTLIPAGTLFALANYTGRATADDTTNGVDELVNFKIYRRVTSSPTTATGTEKGANPTVTTGSFSMAESTAGSTSFSTAKTITVSAATVEGVATAISNAGFTNITASVSNGYLTVSHTLGGEIKIVDAGGILTDAGFDPNQSNSTATANFYTAGADDDNTFVISNWKALVYEAKDDAPTSVPADGTLWYDTTLDEVDIMIHDGSKWVGYLNYGAYAGSTDPAGPIVSATEPAKTGGQSDGTDLVTGDIWIDTSDVDEYGAKIYKYDATANAWVQVDVTDQTTEDGILFADARYGSTGATGDTEGTITALLSTNYVDPDAPDPALYPKGMLLWNTRRSGFNVKKFVRGHIDVTANSGKNTRFGDEAMVNSLTGAAIYATNRWIGWNTTNEDGSGVFGRHAQRKTVVQAMKAAVDTNDALRDEETRNFTLLSAPGYPELATNLVSLNIDRGITGFVVADTPFRLQPTATALLNYGNNTAGATGDGEDALVTYDEYMAAFYPSGFTTDFQGNNIVVPPSHMMLRTIAVSDAVSYPWFAPAGTRRGGISNASSVGYIDSEGEFNAVALNEGIRDTMAGVKINPLTFITGNGLVNFGQYTRARNASSLDRINVARLVSYMRRQLTLLAKPFMFEPNDKITRDEIKQATESLLLELVGQRAVYDFLVVCDETNNTPSRIDRNELYVDVAIEPVKAVEFIYIPLRLKNTGEIATLGNQ